MSESNSNNQIPNVDSEEFEAFLKEHGFDRIKSEPIKNIPTSNNDKKRFDIKKYISAIDQWSLQHPGFTLAIIIFGGTIVSYKVFQSFVAGSVFKGNLKTLKYLNRLN